MARYQITAQRYLNGRVISTSSVTVEANSISEAKNKFMANHPPSNSYKYKIIACVKK